MFYCINGWIYGEVVRDGCAGYEERMCEREKKKMNLWLVGEMEK